LITQRFVFVERILTEQKMDGFRARRKPLVEKKTKRGLVIPMDNGH